MGENEKLQALFKSMQEWGYVPKEASFDEFAAKHDDPTKQLGLYNFLKGNGHVSMPAEEFVALTFVKKKEPGGQQSQVSQEASLASSSPSRKSANRSQSEGSVMAAPR